MICILTRHFKLNRILMLAIGLWPGEKSKLARFQQILLHTILTSFITVQLTTFVTAKWTPDLFIQIFSSVFMFINFEIKYSSFWINIENVRGLLKQLQHICSKLKDENEISIIEKYGWDAKLYTIGITTLTAICLLIINIQTIYSIILGFSQSSNNSQQIIPVMTEYFIDPEKYFYLIQLHTNAAICVGAIVLTATGTILITYLKHTCGMFMIASYRLEQAMSLDVQQAKLQKETVIYNNMISAVDIHRKAMHLSTLLISTFEGMIFFLTTCGVLSMTLNLYRMFQIISFEDNKGKSIIYLINTGTVLIYIFIANNAGQEVTDHNNHIFLTAYSVQWYTASIKVQKLILFLLQRGSKTFYLGAGGLFVASLETAATLASASISYFTVLYSTRQ